MRKLRTILVAASLTLCVLTLVAWPVSFYRAATVRRLGPRLIAAAHVGAGRVSLFCQTHPAPAGHTPPTVWSATVGPVRERFFRANQRWRDTVRFQLDAQAWRTSGDHDLIARTVAVPLWCPAVLAALPPTVAAERWAVRRRRARAGRCVGCGYDLRHSPGRCPECGTTPA